MLPQDKRKRVAECTDEVVGQKKKVSKAGEGLMKNVRKTRQIEKSQCTLPNSTEEEAFVNYARLSDLIPSRTVRGSQIRMPSQAMRGSLIRMPSQAKQGCLVKMHSQAMRGSLINVPSRAMRGSLIGMHVYPRRTQIKLQSGCHMLRSHWEVVVLVLGGMVRL
ncbi:hypothetical protein Fot_22235 [Forsythia ovata]|uniref:Uncharacterized protein n=1 Tax=Forsythia ovata TaxID=205694 RepID=A0ABD1UX50_9LAMI